MDSSIGTRAVRVASVLSVVVLTGLVGQVWAVPVEGTGRTTWSEAQSMPLQSALHNDAVDPDEPLPRPRLG